MMTSHLKDSSKSQEVKRSNELDLASAELSAYLSHSQMIGSNGSDSLFDSNGDVENERLSSPCSEDLNMGMKAIDLVCDLAAQFDAATALDAAMNRSSNVQYSPAADVSDEGDDRLGYADAISEASWSLPTSTPVGDPKYVAAVLNEFHNHWQCDAWLVHINERGSVVGIHAFPGNSHSVEPTVLRSIAIDIGTSDGVAGVGMSHLEARPSLTLKQAFRRAIAWSIPMPRRSGRICAIFSWEFEPNARLQAYLASWLPAEGNSTLATFETWALCEFATAKVAKRSAVLGVLKHWRTIVALVCVCAMAMFIPIPYRPQRECVLEAGQRHFVSSPIEGRLMKTFVRPSDMVSKGQLLASLDDQMIIRDLSTAESQLASAMKKKEVALATRAGGELRLAQLETEQIQLRIDALRDQLDRLQITSPVDGVLVQGDWFGNDGMPVTLGQSLFEIADLNDMVGEIRLKSEDLPYVHVGSVATVRTEATGTESFPAPIQRIEPHAELIDDQAIFIADVDLSNSKGLLRPGMKCDAVVDQGYQRAGWILFRKPYRWLMNQAIW